MPDPSLPRRFSSDVVVSGAAIFISLCTLVVLLYEARIMREQQRAAVWPYVEIGPGFGDDGFHVIISNQGIGPARIQSMQVRVEDEPVRTWRAMFRVLGVAESIEWQDKTNGRVIPAQSEIRSVRAAGGERAAEIARALLAEKRLAFELCYCSVYDECWRVARQGRDETREAVGSCGGDPAAEFQL
jgi:hypothetical protein